MTPIPPDMMQRLKADPALAARVLRLCEPSTDRVRVLRPEDAAPIFRPLLDGREAEAFAVAALDRRGTVIEAAILTTGSDAATVVDPRQVFRWALTRARPAHSVLVAHNHPSGDPEPSAEDMATTRRLVAAGVAIGVAVRDHLVLTDAAGFVSMAARGML